MKKSVLFALCSCMLFISKAQVGSLDSSFGINGIKHFQPVLSDGLNVLKVITAPDKTTYVVYVNYSYYEQVVVARFLADGSPDLSYGNAGYSEWIPMHFADAAVQPGGQLVLAGTTVYGFYSDIHDDIMIVKLKVNGLLDPSFNIYGYVTATFSGFSYEYIRSVTVSNDLIAVNGYSISVIGQFAVHHVYLFDMAGVNLGKSIYGEFLSDLQTFDPANVKAAVAIQGQKVVIASATWDGNRTNFELSRVNADGSPDLGFGKDGKDTIGNAFFEDVSAIGINGDKIIVASKALNPVTGIYGIKIGRYNNNGSPDNSFNGTGFSAHYFSADQYLLPKAIMAQGDKIIIGGDNFNLSTQRREFALLRYSYNGSLDKSFDLDGMQTTGLTGQEFSLDDLAIYGKHLLISGLSKSNLTGEISGLVARYLLENNSAITISCPSAKEVNTDKGLCHAVVKDIDPVTTAPASGVRYTFTGATTGSGAGSASGKRFNKGVTTCTYSLPADPTRTCSFTITVTDREVPVIAGAAASPGSLWPPNHKMRDVSVTYTTKDNCGAVSTTLSVKSNEPTAGTDKDDIANDWQVIDANHVRLRAERSGKGKGRIYTITIKATDAAGNMSSKDIAVAVPHSGGPIKQSYGSKDVDVSEEADLEVKVLPNPSANYFTFIIGSKSAEKISMNVWNELGTLMQKFDQVPARNNFQIGQNYPAGVYMVEIIQGNIKATRRLVKL